jgi:hypothetical protein
MATRDVSAYVAAEGKLWRYMSFTKYMSFLQSRALHHARADQFLDPYEGFLPSLRVRYERDPLKVWIPDGGPGVAKGEELLQHAYTMRRQSFVSCWQKGEHESDSMWNLYSSSSEGIAIVTRVKLLAQAFLDYHETQKVNGFTSLYARLSEVEYVDPTSSEEQWIEGDELLFYKRKGFDAEREVRLIVIHHRPPAGVSWSLPLEMELGEFVEEVIVAPRAPHWFLDLVTQVSPKGFRIRRSALHGSPEWESVAAAANASSARMNEIINRHPTLFPRAPNNG